MSLDAVFTKSVDGRAVGREPCRSDFLMVTERANGVTLLVPESSSTVIACRDGEGVCRGKFYPVDDVVMSNELCDFLAASVPDAAGICTADNAAASC